MLVVVSMETERLLTYLIKEKTHPRIKFCRLKYCILNMFKESSSWLLDNEDRTSIMECCRPELNSPWDEGYSKPTQEQDRKEKIPDGIHRIRQ